ncbi:MAG: Flp pilus assembly protein CpaB [Candidatus Dadabacteria bacterium]|nr:MAG: Flp pilus assembly protein CpaB [Candidatus Dadabacteria bacterium]
MAARKLPVKYRGGRKSNPIVSVAVLSVAIVVAAIILRGKPQDSSASAAQAPVVAQYDVVSVPVPVSYVPAGTPLKNIKIKWVSFPRHQLPPNALTSLDGLRDAVTVAALPASLPMFPDNFNRNGEYTNPVIGQIPPGMRAMTVRVDATAAVEGWARTGSIVDVLLVTKDKTTVVAEKVKIISAERSLDPNASVAENDIPGTVTLLVSQEQCLAINTAIPQGKIAFALRGAKDADVWSMTDFTSDRLGMGSRVASKSSNVNGYITVKGEKGEETYALSDGKWIRADVKPQGFFVAGEEREKDSR